MNSFFPPRRILMGAGPTEIPARVLSATARAGRLMPAASVSVQTTKGMSFSRKSVSTTSLYFGSTPA